MVSRWLCMMCAVVLFIAGVSKLVALDDFSAALESWTIMPGAFRTVGVFLVPPIEVLTGALWLMSVRRPNCEQAMIVLGTVFVTVLGTQHLLAQAPSCGCIGLIDQFFSERASERIAIGRACGFLVASVAGHVGSRVLFAERVRS